MGLWGVAYGLFQMRLARPNPAKRMKRSGLVLYWSSIGALLLLYWWAVFVRFLPVSLPDGPGDVFEPVRTPLREKLPFLRARWWYIGLQMIRKRADALDAAN